MIANDTGATDATDFTDEDLWETTDRVFVRDLPIWERFLIWLFPRMYDIRSYDIEWHASKNG